MKSTRRRWSGWRRLGCGPGGLQPGDIDHATSTPSTIPTGTSLRPREMNPNQTVPVTVDRDGQDGADFITCRRPRRATTSTSATPASCCSSCRPHRRAGREPGSPAQRPGCRPATTSTLWTATPSIPSSPAGLYQAGQGKPVTLSICATAPHCRPWWSIRPSSMPAGSLASCRCRLPSATSRCRFERGGRVQRILRRELRC